MKARMQSTAVAALLILTAAAHAETAAPAAKPAKPAAKAAAPAAAEDKAPAVPARAEEILSAPETTDRGPLRENSYFYGAFGTRDPFRSLLAGDFEPRLQELVDINTVQLVGVIWEPDDIAAMVQDSQGFGYTLRSGDALKNGQVVAVKRDALVARLNVFGQTTQVTLRMQRDDEE